MDNPNAATTSPKLREYADDVHEWPIRQLTHLYKHFVAISKDPWDLLASIPRGIALEQGIAELMEQAFVALEAQGYSSREDIWLMWP